MVAVAHQIESPAFDDKAPLVLRLRPVIEMTDDQFFEFCQINSDLRIERTAHGEIEIMPPTGWKTGGRNADIVIQLGIWAKQDGRGGKGTGRPTGGGAVVGGPSGGSERYLEGSDLEEVGEGEEDSKGLVKKGEIHEKAHRVHFFNFIFGEQRLRPRDRRGGLCRSSHGLAGRSGGPHDPCEGRFRLHRAADPQPRQL